MSTKHATEDLQVFAPKPGMPGHARCVIRANFRGEQKSLRGALSSVGIGMPGTT
jgi:hypothetical protein